MSGIKHDYIEVTQFSGDQIRRGFDAIMQEGAVTVKNLLPWMQKQIKRELGLEEPKLNWFIGYIITKTNEAKKLDCEILPDRDKILRVRVLKHKTFKGNTYYETKLI